jgi:6-phosphofructokinase 1
MNTPIPSDLLVETLGSCTVDSPLSGSHRIRFIKDFQRVILPSLTQDLTAYLEKKEEIPSFELAGAREKIFFNPREVRCGIITCGGLCPGLNHVIRSITLTSIESYGVKQVWGFRYGFAGLSSSSPLPPLDLNADTIRNIQDLPGTVLGSSRGPQSEVEMVDTLQKYSINMLS